ncbi:hypothetical protein LguiB_035858 [Lonicera macranthoides]
MASVACFNYFLALVVAVTVWLQAGIIEALAVTSTTATNKNNLSQPPWFKREFDDRSNHCNWEGISCNEAGSVTSLSCPQNPYLYGEARIAELNLPSYQSLEILDLSGCGLAGTIPQEIGRLSKLTRLSLSRNSLSGGLPVSLANLTSLTWLNLSSNSFSGPIPSEIGNLANLSFLDLGNNYFSGSIPPSVGFLTLLTYLDLSRNQLNGSIPSKIGNLMNLSFLNLSNNYFLGPIPSSIYVLTHLTFLDLSRNRLTGFLPLEIQNLSNLLYLLLEGNNLSGTIPSTMGLLTNLARIDLSRNFFNGTIPTNISYLSKLNYIDLSYNKLVGPVPTNLWDLCSSSNIQLLGNKGLEGNLSCELNIKDQNKGRNIIRDLIPIFILLATISLAMMMILGAHRFLSWHKVAKNKSLSVTKHGNMCSIWNYDGTIAYEDIIKSTNDFDIKHCIGTGSYGSVYRAQLPSGKVVALKKLHRFEAEEPSFDKCFKNEVQVLSNIRHKNIVKLYGFCFHNRCMFLVYEYMERGSLFYALRDNAVAIELDWIKRVSIVKGIAHALSYMHHDCTPPIAHRDISSNNILLNSKQDAFVADFGAARLLSPDSSNQTLIAGTRGYIAPGERFFLYNCSIPFSP